MFASLPWPHWVHCMFACWWLIALISADGQIDKKTYRLTDRQTGRETFRQTDRQTDIQTVPFPPLLGQSCCSWKNIV